MCEGNTSTTVEGQTLRQLKNRVNYKICQEIKIWRSMVRHEMNSDDISNGVNRQELLEELKMLWPGGEVADLMWGKLKDKMRKNLGKLWEWGLVSEGAHGATIYSPRLKRWLRADWTGDVSQLDPARTNAPSTAAELSPQGKTKQVVKQIVNNTQPLVAPARRSPTEPQLPPAPPANPRHTSPHNIVDLKGNSPTPSAQQQPQVSELQSDVQVLSTTSYPTDREVLMTEAPPLPPTSSTQQPPQHTDTPWSPAATFDSSYARSNFSHPDALPAPLEFNKSAQNVNPAMLQAHALEGIAALQGNPAALSLLGMTPEGLAAVFNLMKIAGSQPGFQPTQTPMFQVPITQHPQSGHPLPGILEGFVPPESQAPPMPVREHTTAQAHAAVCDVSQSIGSSELVPPQPLQVSHATVPLAPQSHDVMPEITMDQNTILQTTVPQPTVPQTTVPQPTVPQGTTPCPATRAEETRSQAPDHALEADRVSKVAVQSHVQEATPAPSTMGERDPVCRSFTVPYASSNSNDEEEFPPRRPEYASEVGTLNPRAPPPPSSRLGTISDYDPRLVVRGNETPALEAPQPERAGLTGAEISSWREVCDRERDAGTPRPHAAANTFAAKALKAVQQSLDQLQRFEDGKGPTLDRDYNWQICQKGVLRRLESL